jgi:ADP-ribose pyrophosphatase YjhB (NUDIX family)
MTRRGVRVGAYGVCIRDERVLLARFVVPEGHDAWWTLPGGGIEHGEDPVAGVVREFREETGFQIRVDNLLGVDTRVRTTDHGTSLHNLGVFYRVTIVGGELTHELDGSTDLAAWVPLADVASLDRSMLVDLGLTFERTNPPDGHIDPIEVGGHLID